MSSVATGDEGGGCEGDEQDDDDGCEGGVQDNDDVYNDEVVNGDWSMCMVIIRLECLPNCANTVA